MRRKVNYGRYLETRQSIWDAERKLRLIQVQAENLEKSREESLRIALITNEINAGRISAIAGLYQPFLYGDKGWGIETRIKALEQAAKIGYVSAEETIEAAQQFEKHLNGVTNEVE